MKLGLGDSYDNVQFISKKARAYLDLTKPASTVGIVGAFILGSLFYTEYTGDSIAIGTVISASVTVAFMHGASQALNMAEDAEMDRQTEHKQNRPIPSGIVTEEEARTIAWFLILFAIGRAYITKASFGVMMTFAVFMGVFYNLSPIRAKERIISIPWQAVSRGLIMFPIIWSAYGNPLQLTPIVLGVFMFFYVLGFQNSADIIDEEVDRKYGIRTFVVEYGLSGVVRIASISTIAMFSTIVSAIYLDILPQKYITMVGIIPFCLLMIGYFKHRPHSMHEFTGNNKTWIYYYAGMMLNVLIPTITAYFG